MDIDLAIREQLRREVRQQRSYEIVGKSLHEHRTAIKSGRTMLVANMRMVDVLREGRAPIVEYAEEGSLFDKAKDFSFSKALDATLEAGMEWGLKPMISSLLSSLGLDRYPALHRAAERVITTAVVNIINDPKYRLYDLDCEDVSQALAEATAEALPEAIFDSLLQGMPAPPQMAGVMLTVREAIGNYFKDRRVMRKITRTISQFVCNVDLSKLLMHGRESIESSLASRGSDSSETGDAP